MTRPFTDAKIPVEKMRPSTYLLTVGFLLPLNVAVAQSTLQEPNTTRRGYVVCAAEKDTFPVPVYEHPCRPPVGELKCDEPVEIVSRKGPFLKMKTSDGSERYVGVTSVSQSKKKFIAIDIPFVPWPNLLDCSAFHEKEVGTHRPIPIYSPNAEYSDQARRAKISGWVQLSLTVGIDGRPHDIVIAKSLGYGLDENAIVAVEQWKFDPATEDGKPIPARITIDLRFRVYK